MKKYLMLGAFLLCLAGGVLAQEDPEEEAYVGGGSLKFSGAILFGNSNFLTSGLTIPGSPGSTYWNVSGQAPYANTVSNNNAITNMIGAEARVFVTDDIAIRLNGGAVVRNTPARDNVPATIDPNSPNVTWIPNYNAVIGDNRFDANFNIGGEYHLVKKGKLSGYVGASIPFNYARWSQYNPTVVVNSNNGVAPATVTITDVATRHVEMVGFGFQLLAGADYNFTNGFYMGLEIKPFSYLYAFNRKFPAPGLPSLGADTHTYGYFVQPMFKMGFMF